MSISLRLSLTVATTALLAVVACLTFAPGSSGGVASVAKADSPNAGTALPRRYRNCKALNRRYRHGVGRRGARDKTSDEPVTTFLRNNRLYERNRHLGRDKDRIACEKL
jgi:Excalibur calcium-binding domain